jgi:hypothetical protein
MDLIQLAQGSMALCFINTAVLIPASVAGLHTIAQN